MQHITILMPMAGLGSRFAKAGVTLPKPLIPVLGWPMFRLALESLRPMLHRARVVAVILEQHDREFGLGAGLREAYPGIEVATLPRLTGGSLETCLAAAPFTRADAGILVLDCDLTFGAGEHLNALRRMLDSGSETDGLLLSFSAEAARYSYAALDSATGLVVRTAEKQVISPHALMGAYAFRSAGRFFRLARSIIAANLRTGGGEFYVSSAYNALIPEGGRVRLGAADQHWSCGTPEELAACLEDPGFQRHVAMLQERAAAASTIEEATP